MPLPRAMKMNETAQAARAPAITTLHENALRPRATLPVWMISTVSPTTAVSLMLLLRRRRGPLPRCCCNNDTGPQEFRAAGGGTNSAIPPLARRGFVVLPGEFHAGLG